MRELVDTVCMVHNPVAIIEWKSGLVSHVAGVHFHRNRAHTTVEENIALVCDTEELSIPVNVFLVLVEWVSTAGDRNNVAVILFQGFLEIIQPGEGRSRYMEIILLHDTVGAFVVTPKVRDNAHVLHHSTSFNFKPQ